MDSLKETEVEKCSCNRVLCANSKQLLNLGKKLKRETLKAYFAYVIGALNKDGCITSEDFKQLMLWYIKTGKSVYTRANARRTIYTFEDARCISEAWFILSKRGMFHSSKLLGNELVEFSGDINEVVRLLMEGYESLGEPFKIGLINALRMRGIKNYNLQMEEKLEESNESIDVKCCIIRLLGNDIEKHSDRLVEILNKYYNSDEWNVRINAAMTLSTFGLSEEEIDKVINGEDRYAADALRWALKDGLEE